MLSRCSLVKTMFLAHASLCLACGPKINHLRAEPNVVCPGSPVFLSWDASAGGTLSATPPDSSLSDVSSAGCTRVNPRSTTRYTLEVRNLFGSDKRQVDVDVRADGGVKEVGASVADPSTTCSNGKLSVSVNLPRDYWAAGLTVAKAQLPAEVHREMRVEHAGHSAVLNDQSPATHEFDGVVPSGSWRLTAPLTAGEGCGTPTIPHSLSISLALGCVE